jgi:hypothetical protein
MSSNRFEDDQDRQAYEALVKRNQWGKVDKLNNIAAKGWGGVVNSASDLPGFREKWRDELLTALAPYADSNGDLHVTMDSDPSKG